MGKGWKWAQAVGSHRRIEQGKDVLKRIQDADFAPRGSLQLSKGEDPEVRRTSAHVMGDPRGLSRDPATPLLRGAERSFVLKDPHPPGGSQP